MTSCFGGMRSIQTELRAHGGEFNMHFIGIASSREHSSAEHSKRQASVHTDLPLVYSTKIYLGASRLRHRFLEQRWRALLNLLRCLLFLLQVLLKQLRNLILAHLLCTSDQASIRSYFIMFNL